MLNIKELTKTYNGIHSLTSVTFIVPENSITGIIGPNGAGKSTILRILAGFELPDSGKMLFRETPFTAFDDIKRLVSFMPEQLEIYPNYLE